MAQPDNFKLLHEEEIKLLNIYWKIQISINFRRVCIIVALQRYATLKHGFVKTDEILEIYKTAYIEKKTVSASTGRTQEQPQNHQWNADTKFILFPRQPGDPRSSNQAGRGTQVGMKAPVELSPS